MYTCAFTALDCRVRSHSQTPSQRRILPRYAVNCHSNWVSVINRVCILLLTSLTLTSITIRQDTK